MQIIFVDIGGICFKVNMKILSRLYKQLCTKVAECLLCSNSKGNMNDNSPRGRFRFRTKSREKIFHLDPVTDNKHSSRRKSLSKNRIYLKTPDNWYHNHPDDPRDVTSSYQRDGTLNRSLSEPRYTEGRRVVYERLFPSPNRRMVRKGMIIGERPSLWKVPEPRSPELPGNLFVDNLRHQRIDWRKYNNVTWNDILDSHLKDVDRTRVNIQTLPQKEAWLASIDSRVRYSKMKPGRGLPHISPRLFNNRKEPPNHLRIRDIYLKIGWAMYSTSWDQVTSRKRSTGHMYFRKQLSQRYLQRNWTFSSAAFLLL